MSISKYQLAGILQAPHISEKSTIYLEEANKKIVFKVQKEATKTQVKKAVESMFTVQVKTVNLLNVKGKQKRFGRFMGKRSDWKKAYVTLKPGYDIDFAAN